MYCTQCGEKQMEGAKFCSNCGTPVHQQDQHLDLAENTTINNEPIEFEYTDIEPSPEFDALQTYVGDKSDYYFNKWEIDQGVIKKSSWNFASFFLNIFWLLYRKMYDVAILIIIAWLVMDAIAYMSGIYTYQFDAFIGLLTSILLGIYGNYIYYLKASKKTQKLQDANAVPSTIQKSGGTTLWSIPIGIILSILYAYISLDVIYPAVVTEPVEFGYEEVGGEIVNPTNQFGPYEEIIYTFYFPDYKGGDYEVVIEKVEDTLILYESWPDYVSPDWEGVIATYVTPDEPGEYIMKIIKKDKVAAKGTFFVD